MATTDPTMSAMLKAPLIAGPLQQVDETTNAGDPDEHHNRKPSGDAALLGCGGRFFGGGTGRPSISPARPGRRDVRRLVPAVVRVAARVMPHGRIHALILSALAVQGGQDATFITPA